MSIASCFRAAVVTSLVLSFGVAAACGEGQDTAVLKGSALEVGGAYGSTMHSIVPDQRIIQMIAVFTNDSPSPVRLLDIKPLWVRGKGDVAEINRIRIGPRKRPNLPSYSRYEYDPPREFRKGKCLFQPVTGVRGYTAQSGETDAILLYIHTLKEGTFKIKGQRVTYEHEGKVYQQVVPFHLGGEVGNKRFPTPEIEQKCVDRGVDS